jgi:hypothetical protein
MTDAATAAEPRREVSWGGRFLGVGIVGMTVLTIIVSENTGVTAVTSNAALILVVALAAAIAVPMAFFRRVITD